MKIKKVTLGALIIAGLMFGTISSGWAAHYLYDPYGPHDNGFWANDLLGTWIPIGPNGATSRWTAATWGNLVQWPTNYQSDGAGGFIINHPISGYLHWYVSPRGGYGLEVGRDTTWPGWDNNGYGAEHNDALIPNYPGWGQDIPDGIISEDSQPALSQLSLLRFRAWQKVLSAWQGNRNGWDYVNTSMIVIFHNETMNQYLWWYVYTYDSRGVYPDKLWHEVGCQYENPLLYEYIVLDKSQGYGFTPLVPGGAGKIYVFSILPRLIAAFNSNPPQSSYEFCRSLGGTGATAPLDTNLSHWKVSTVYVGSIVGGEGIINSMHDHIMLGYE